MPIGAVTSGIGVISSRTVRVANSSAGTKSRSRLVMMPSRVRSAVTTGRPETRYCPQSASSSARVASGLMVTGSETMPDSDRLTRSTWWACSSIERLRCSTPMPPSRAIATAIRASVTVSIAADSSGTRTEISRVSREVVSTSDGTTSVSCGRSRTSSNVSASGASLSGSFRSSTGPCYRRRASVLARVALTVSSLRRWLRRDQRGSWQRTASRSPSASVALWRRWCCASQSAASPSPPPPPAPPWAWASPPAS